jgi:hypothetical protein
MRKLFLGIGMMSMAAGVFGQQAELNVATYDDATLASLPRLTMPAGYGTRPLPSKKDNTKLIYFPGIYSQEVWNCNQAASVWLMYTYEVNYLRNLESAKPENQYSPMAVFNLLNYGNPGQGVSYFDSWNLIKANGVPGNTDFTAYSQNSQVWMTGYDKYYRGMQNRVDQVYAIEVGTPDGLTTLKHWLNDHLSGDEVGGIANFQIGSGDMVIPQIPTGKGLEAEGEYIVTKYGPWVGHAMSFAGWNDSVKYDYNNDGRYTNNVDINSDGVVDMKDWEVGAMLVVNSWGTWWGNHGKVWVMYRVLAEDIYHGGIWNNAVMVVKPKKTYQPLMTVKTKIRYNQRNRLKLQVGVASTQDAREPEFQMDFPCFNYQGDTLPMQGFYGPNSDLIEIGLDITPLLDKFPANGTAKIFFDVIQTAPNDRGAGRVEGFSVIDYTNGTHEFTVSGVTDITDNALTRLTVMASSKPVHPEIISEELPDAVLGQEYRVQIEADGQVTPLRFSNPETVYNQTETTETLGFTGGTKVLPLPFDPFIVKDLPFSFPFYGQNYTQIAIHSNGAIIMGSKVVKYPYVIDDRLPFYHNPGAYPYFGSLYYPDTRHQVTFEASVTQAVVRWNAAIDTLGTESVEFAARITPDGRITFYYGSMPVTPAHSWIAGVSMGNQLNYTLMSYVHSGIQSNKAYQVQKQDWPAWLTLGSTGDLKGTPAAPGSWSLPIELTDGHGLKTSKTLTLKTAGFSGTGSILNNTRISVYPNPVADATNIRVLSEKTGILSLEILDLSGRSLMIKTFEIPAGEHAVRIEETSALAPGIYYYRFSGIAEGNGKLLKM